ncbi:MAG: N-acetylglucosamine-6-phosphate deacetylase [Lachnospiraceae bacterium]|nr:N-acetylglucosamine-6-phosphate deacetylase [Lachnospiraceae bacterium]
MWIKNVRILTEEGIFLPGEIQTEGERIKKVHFTGKQEKPEGEPVMDGNGGILFPGMIDMHFHGAAGYDFCDGTMEALGMLAKFEASIGVTAICPAAMTLPKKRTLEILQNAKDFKKHQIERPDISQADFVGIHMEGPFISPKKKGAQDENFILPCSSDDFFSFQEASGGLVRVIAFAPEEVKGESAREFIRQVGSQAVVALAHTDASYDIAKETFEMGASHAVHLFNAMPELYHREPGAAGAALDSCEVTVELICDGVHIHPAVIRLVLALKKRKVILVSDSMRATGLTDGRYTLGGQDVEVTGNRAVLVSDGSLAGSVTTLPDCVRYAVKEAGIPLADALHAATFAPAERLGIEKDYGSIREGKFADLVLWDDDLRLKMVIHHGNI